MAELAETLADYNVYGVNADGVGGLGVWLRTPGVMDHTSVPIHMTTTTYETIDQTVHGTCLDVWH